MLHRVGVRVPMPAPRRRGRHIVRGDFFTKVTSHSFCRGSFPNRTRYRWAPVWVRRCAAVLSYRKKISILTVSSKKEDMAFGHVFLFGFRPPKAASTLRYLNAQGGEAAPPPRFLPSAKTLVRRNAPPHFVGPQEGKRKCSAYSSSSLRTAINASVGSCTVPKVRIFFFPSLPKIRLHQIINLLIIH